MQELFKELGDALIKKVAHDLEFEKVLMFDGIIFVMSKNVHMEASNKGELYQPQVILSFSFSKGWGEVIGILAYFRFNCITTPNFGYTRDIDPLDYHYDGVIDLLEKNNILVKVKKIK